MELIKRPYELSIWEFTPGEEKTSETQLAIIGTNTMSSPMRAMEPIFIKNVNGTFTLEFKLYTRYFDTEKGEFAENPYINLLMAERFLKLKYKDKWYDLIIKSRQESSDSKTYTYTATSMHINELSKSGFNLEFKTELENNQGTILELGNKIMEGTDWTIDEEGSDIIRATQKEQLVICTYSDDVNVTPILGGNEEKTLSGNFYVFYSDYAKVMSLEEGSAEIQVLYINHGDASDLDEYINEGNYSDEEGILTIGENCLFTATKSNLTKVKLSQFTGRRIVKQQKTRYNSALDKYVSIYNDGKVEGFVETEYLTSQIVQNLITNSKDFQSTSGWYYSPGEDSDDPAPIIEVDYYPPLLDFIKIEDDSSKVEENTEITSRLKLTGKTPSQKFYNTGLRSHLSYIDSIKEGESYILQVNLVNENNESVGKFSKDNANIGTTVRFCFKYQREITEGSEEENGFFDKADGTGKDDEWGISSENSNWEYINNEYNQIELIFPKAISKEDLKKFRFEIQIDNKDTSVFIKEIQLFKKIEKTDGSFVIPGEVPESKVIENKFFYNVEENKDNTSREKYQWLSNNENYEPFYDKDYNKIASIEKSESNRFNLIQDLCEKFECWANFNITHNDDGTIDKKTIQFKEYAGDVKYAGFTYGINLASIKRTINSSQIVTKTIVQQNTNEHGTDSFCSISRAKENPTGQNFILNFDYYINQGLLNKDTTYADLEDYYSTAKPITQEQQTLINSQQAISASLLQTKALLESSTQIRDNAEQEIAQLETEYFQYTKLVYPNINSDCIVTEKIENEDGTVTEKTEIVDSKVREYIVKIQNLEKILKSSKEEVEKYSGEISVLEETYENNKEELEAKNNELTKVNDAFFKKYGNYIFEGTWSSEDYWDDSLYYLDALDVSRTSSKPQVTYTINVIDISMQEGYEPYDIDVGDKSFIEDVEFFGYVYWFDGERALKKPYREEIVVTELKEYLDSPEKNEIKVQNYKTQFEDLFQRITASTQQLQYARGGYNRASAAFNNDGTIDGSILQNTLLSYAFTLLNPENDSVIWDEDGIKIIDRKNVDRILKLSGGELAITNDGGATWSTAIDANGIHLNLVTSGTINTDKIMIGNSENYAFRWDRTGLNAYTEKADGGGYDYGKFVRFDQYGLYGYSGGTIFDPLSLDEVKQSADFGLTWDGFFLKSKHDDPNDKGYIEIDSKEDFQVFGSDGELRVKIGLIGEETEDQTITNEAGETVTETVITDRIYGLRLYDKDGNSVVDTDSNGNISITGTIKATSGNIGNWKIVNGNITSAQTETEYGTQGIVLDATNSQIYSAQYKTSSGMDGWSINNDEAIFNNITLRGALKCAVLEYGEVQAVGGILMIRPSTSIKEALFFGTSEQDPNKYSYYKDIDKIQSVNITESSYLELEVENPLWFYEDDWVKIASAPLEDGQFKEDFIREDEKGVTLYTGINTNLLRCIGHYYKEKTITEAELDANGNIVRDNNGNPMFIETKKMVQVVLLDLADIPLYADNPDATGTSIEGIKGLNLKGMGLVDLGKTPQLENGKRQDSIGISLNSSENNVIVPQTSFSMFTLEERETTINGNRTWKHLKPHIILGKIPNDSIYHEDIQGKYGLYADAAEIKGTIRARHLYVGDNNKDYIDSNTGLLDPEIIGGITDIQNTLETLQKEVDGVIDTWYYNGVPTNDTFPANTWSDEEKASHQGDLYYDKDSGISYRYFKNDYGNYSWESIADTDVTAALEQIIYLQDQIDEKVTIYYNSIDDEPDKTKVKDGDLWIRPDGTFLQYDNSVGDWVIITIANQGVVISGEQVFKSSDGESYSPNYITLTATVPSGVSFGSWYYKDPTKVNQTNPWTKIENDDNFIEINSSGSSETKSVLKVFPKFGGFSDNIATFRITAGSTEEYEDIFSIAKLSDGQDGTSPIVATLSNETHTVSANAEGEVFNNALNDAITTITVYEGTTDVSNNEDWSYTCTYPNSIEIEISNSGRTIKVKTFSKEANSAYVDITASKGSTSITKTFIITKVRQGIQGVQGASTIQAVLSNEYHAIPCYSNGEPIDGNKAYTGAETTISIYEGATEIDYKGWGFSTNPVSISGQLSGRTYIVSEITDDSGYVDITATKDNLSITKRFTVDKNKSGIGKYFLEVDNNVIKVDINGNIIPTTIAYASRTMDRVESTVAATLVIDRFDGTNFSNYSTQNSIGAGSITVSDLFKNFDLKAVRLRLYKNQTEKLLDQITIPVLRDGPKGDKGDDAVRYYLSTSTQFIKRDANGNISPSSITIYSKKQTGNSDSQVSSYLVITTSSNGVSFTDETAITTSGSYTYSLSNSSSLQAIKIQQYDSSSRNTLLSETIIPVLSDGPMGPQGPQGTILEKVEIEYNNSITNSAPTDDWSQDIPKTYEAGKYYWYRYKYTFKNPVTEETSTDYSDAIPWDNPYRVEYYLNTGSVLAFDENGKLVQNFAPNLKWSYVSNATDKYPDRADDVDQDDSSKDFVAIKLNGKDYTVSNNGLIIQKNAVVEGTIIASNGIIGGWEIGSRSVSNKSVYYLKDTNNTIWLDSAGQSAEINNSTGNMVLKVGKNFGVSDNGTLYASNAKIKGEITATSLTVVRSEQKEETLDEILNSLQTEVQGISITGEQVFKKTSSGVSPASITLNTQMVGNLTINKWEYKRGDGNGSWDDLNTTNSSFTINSSDTNPNFDTFFNNNNNITSFRVTAKDNNNNSYSDTFSVYIVSDGEDGNPGEQGQSPLLLVLSNEYQGIPCDENGNPTISGTLANTTATVYKGSEDISGYWNFVGQSSEIIFDNYDDGSEVSVNSGSGEINIKAFYRAESIEKTLTVKPSGPGMYRAFVLDNKTGNANEIDVIKSTEKPTLYIYRKIYNKNLGWEFVTGYTELQYNYTNGDSESTGSTSTSWEYKINKNLENVRTIKITTYNNQNKQTMFSSVIIPIISSDSGLVAKLTEDYYFSSSASQGLTTKMKVYKNLEEVTNQCFFKITPTSTLNTTINRVERGNNFSINSLNSDVGYLKITAQGRSDTEYSEKTLERIFTISKNKQGATGSSAKSVTISGEQVFKKDSNSETFSPNSIVLTPIFQGDIGYKVDNTSGNWYYKDPNSTADDGFSDLDSTISGIQIDSNTGALTISSDSNCFTNNVATFKVTDSTGNYYDIFSIYKVTDGAVGAPGRPGTDAYTILLSNENFSFTADKNGNIVANSDGSNQSTTCTVSALKGTSSINVQITNWSSSNSNVSITSPTTFPTGSQSSITLAIQAAKNTNIGENGKITLTIKVDGKTFTKELTYSVTKQGADGAPGNPGDPAIYAVLSNEYHAIPCYSNGTVMGTNPYDGASTTMYVYEGSDDKSSDWDYDVAAISNIRGELSNNVFTVTGIDTDIGYVDIIATKNGQSLTKRFTVEKNKSGTSGYYLEVSHNVIKKEGNNYTPSSISTACRTINGETATTLGSTLVIEYSTGGNEFAEYSRSDYNGFDSISISGIINEIGSSGSLAMVRARLYKNNSDLLIDQVTIPVISDGVKGDKGDKGNTGDPEEVDSTTTTYAKNTDPNNHPTSGWDEAVPLVYEGEYLWTKVEVTYKNSDQSGISYTVVAGKEINENLLIASTVNIPYAEEYFVNDTTRAELFNKFKTYFYQAPATTVKLTNNGFSLTQTASSPQFYTASFSAKQGTNYYLSFDAISNNSSNSEIKIYTYYSGQIILNTQTVNPSKKRLNFALSSDYIKENQEIYFGFYCNTGSAGLTINNIKVEEGTTATPFTPSPCDPMYQNLLLDKSYVLKTDGNGKLTGEFAPKARIEKSNGKTYVQFLDNNGNAISKERYEVSETGLITTTNLVAKGTIIASAGIIGGCEIVNGQLQVPVANIGTLTVGDISGLQDQLKSKASNTQVQELNNELASKASTAEVKTMFTNYGTTEDGNFLVLGRNGYGTNSEGQNYIKIDANGLLTARNAVIWGTIYASAGEIGGWQIGSRTVNKNRVYYLKNANGSFWLDSLGQSTTINGTMANMVLKVGSNFGVSDSGTLYATGVKITGNITATEGVFGNLKISNQESLSFPSDDYFKFNEYTYLSSNDNNNWFRIIPQGMTIDGSNPFKDAKIFMLIDNINFTPKNSSQAFLRQMVRLGIQPDPELTTSYIPFFSIYGKTYSDDLDTSYLEATEASIGTISSSVSCSSSMTFSNSSSKRVYINSSGISIYDTNNSPVFLVEEDSGVTIQKKLSLPGLQIYNTAKNSQKLKFYEGFEIGGTFTGENTAGMGFLELYGSTNTNKKTPHIDFHYNNNDKDFTSRIIDQGEGQLAIIAAKNEVASVSGSTVTTKHTEEGDGYKSFEYIKTGVNKGFQKSGNNIYYYINCLELKTPQQSAVVIGNGYSDNSGTWEEYCFRTSTSAKGGALLGTWSLNGATMSATSDRNLKNSINTLSDKYSELFDNLIPVQYKFNNGTSDRFHTGFIAQDVEEAILKVGLTTQDFAGFVKDNEETVVTEDGTVKQQLALRYEEFISLNTNEIQKLKKRVAELEAQLARLTAAT